MTQEKHPKLQRYMTNGFLILRDGLVLTFFIRRPHQEISAAVLRALDLYRDAVGPEKLGWYTHADGELHPLDSEGWTFIQGKLRSENGWPVELWESDEQVGGYRFEYRARLPALGSNLHSPDATCAAAFWLPTEYLEERGSARVKELAVALARELPLSTGYASLAFNTLSDELGVDQMLHELAFRYPGLDILDMRITQRIGARPKGAYWLNFYGQPLLEKLGGASGLRERLALPGVSLQELEADKVMVALGEWPEVEGEMRPYRQLARVLEPHLYQETVRWPGFPPEELRRWERRFLD